MLFFDISTNSASNSIMKKKSHLIMKFVSFVKGHFAGNLSEILQRISLKFRKRSNFFMYLFRIPAALLDEI